MEQDEVAVAEPRLAAGVVQQHHRQQAAYLGVVREQLGQRAAQPARLRRELVAAAVPLVEDQVDDREDGVEALAEQVVRWHAERDACRLDLALGPDEALRHRALRYEEGPGDLVRRQPAQRAEGERDLRLDRERGVAAREDELDALVREGRLVHLPWRGCGQQTELAGKGLLSADPIGGAVARRSHQPGARVFWYAVARPALGGDGERLLRGVLGEVEVAEDADQGGENAAPLLAEDPVERRYQEVSEGRISTAPP